MTKYNTVRLTLQKFRYKSHKR